MTAGKPPDQPPMQRQGQGRIEVLLQSKQPPATPQQRSMATIGQSPVRAAQNLKSVPSSVPGAQQKPALDVVGLQAKGRPSPEAQKSPKEATKSPAGQLVRNRVKFNPLA
jgi:hypothetical protein